MHRATIVLARLWSATLFGIEASLVRIEVDVSFGLPVFAMVGLPDSCVRESRDRVRSAIRNSGYEFPAHRVTVNLAPADIRKRGTWFDLPIAVGVLAASGAIPQRDFSASLLLGELSLDGDLRTTPGVLPVARAARAHDLRLLLPPGSAREAALVPKLPVGTITSLTDAVAVLGGRPAPVPTPVGYEPHEATPDRDLTDVRGQLTARRALEIAAAGHHNLLFVGPPGAGKTLLARRVPGILPPLTFDEAIETTAIHSVWGSVPADDGVVRERPFRAPHHTIPPVALIGGGRDPRPGELSLAHNGVLFLDEITEFARRTLEVLRQPLEEGEVRIARLAGVARFPARCMLLGAMNPCACGFLGDPRRACRCTPGQIARHQQRLSGPMRDRFDLVVPVTALPPDVLTSTVPGEASSVVRGRVVAARQRQQERHRDMASRWNAQLSHARLAEHCPLGVQERRVLDRAARRLGLSARGYDRLRRVARTIADLDGSGGITTADLSEALQYRGQDAGAT